MIPENNIEQAPNRMTLIVSPAKKCLLIYPNKNAAVTCGMTTEKLNTAKYAVSLFSGAVSLMIL